MFKLALDTGCELIGLGYPVIVEMKNGDILTTKLLGIRFNLEDEMILTFSCTDVTGMYTNEIKSIKKRSG